MTHRQTTSWIQPWNQNKTVDISNVARNMRIISSRRRVSQHCLNHRSVVFSVEHQESLPTTEEFNLPMEHTTIGHHNGKEKDKNAPPLLNMENLLDDDVVASHELEIHSAPSSAIGAFGSAAEANHVFAEESCAIVTTADAHAHHDDLSGVDFFSDWTFWQPENHDVKCHDMTPQFSTQGTTLQSDQREENISAHTSSKIHSIQSVEKLSSTEPESVSMPSHSSPTMVSNSSSMVFIEEDGANSRHWKLRAYNSNVFTDENLLPKVVVEMKHRREKRHLHVEENLYSSIRYETFVTLKWNGTSKVHHSTHDIGVRLSALETKNGGTVNIPLKDQSKFDGHNHTQLTEHVKPRKLKNTLHGQLSVHFDSSLSHYFTKKDYMMQMVIYAQPKDASENEICLLRLDSPTVRLFARKANKKNASKKRTHSDVSPSDDVVPVLKRRRSALLADFEMKLDSLLQLSFMKERPDTARQQILERLLSS